jgi:hypothetical protein
VAVDDSDCVGELFLDVRPSCSYQRFVCAVSPQIVVTWNSSVPLSAYELDQEFTYRPNDSLPSLPLSYMVPEILQHSSGGFTPQIITVGDTIQLNDSSFSFTIAEAFDVVNAQPVSSFLYYNNPFSTGCDVVRGYFSSVEFPLQCARQANMTVGVTMVTSVSGPPVEDIISSVVDFMVRLLSSLGRNSFKLPRTRRSLSVVMRLLRSQ